MSKINDWAGNVKTRPDKTSVKIVLTATLIVLGLWFAWVSPLSASLASAEKERDAAQVTNDALGTEIASFRSGESFTPAELPAAAGPAELLVPAKGDPTPAANRVKELALSSRLEVTSISFPNSYSEPQRNALTAPVAVTVAGSTDDIAAWIEQLYEFDQLLTVATSGLTVDDSTGRATLTATVTVYATNLDSWADGVAQPSEDNK